MSKVVNNKKNNNNNNKFPKAKSLGLKDSINVTTAQLYNPESNESINVSPKSYNREEKNNENLFDELENFSHDNDEIGLSINKTLNNEHRIFKILVCQPDHRNITTIFSLMEHIIKDVADEIRSLPSSASVLTEQHGLSNIAAMMSTQLKSDLLLESFLVLSICSKTLLFSYNSLSS